MAMRIKWFLLTLVLVTIVLGLCFGLYFHYIRNKYPIKIVLITIDSIRADHLSCYGYPKNTSPQIDKFSKRAAIFANAFTPRTVTTPALASVLTGLYPHSHGVREVLIPISSAIETLPMLLHTQQYTTAAFLGNAILMREKGGAMNHGFDIYDDTMHDARLHPGLRENKAPTLNASVMRWLEENHQRKFFLWVHYQDVHWFYEAPQEYQKLFTHSEADMIEETKIRLKTRLPWIRAEDGLVDAESYRDAYDAEIRFCDQYVGKLLDQLDALGVSQDALIVITADHGESLGEHDEYFRHGSNVYDEALHVPLLVFYPGITPQRISAQASLVDVTPTILDIVHLRHLSENMEGRSLWPLLRKRQPQVENPVFMEKGNELKGVRTARWKFIVDLATKKEELYDMRSDPGESRNVIGENPEVADSLRLVLSGWLNEKDSVGSSKPQQLTDDQVKSLRSLGYVE